MVDATVTAADQLPKLSVVIPLGYHRGQARECVTAWCRGQTATPADFEVIAIAPPDYSADERAALASLLRPQDRLLHSRASHDASLSVEGAAVARAPTLFFTESHVHPDADAAEQSLAILAAHPDWAGFSGASGPIIPNRLAVPESRMYEADIHEGMTAHPWRRILDHCFVTRREPYDAVGGLDGELGHFAEWALAARYRAAGHHIGYAPQLRVKHYYIGNFRELETFTRDFVDGEITYAARSPHARGEALSEEPPQWSARGALRKDLARTIVRQIMASPAVWRQPGAALRALRRWLPAAIGGARPARLRAAIELAWRKLVVRAALIATGDDGLSAAFNRYITALIHLRRTMRVAEHLARGRETRGITGTEWSAPAPSTPAMAGFDEVEWNDGLAFRWTKPEAVTEWVLPPGTYRVDVLLAPNAVDPSACGLTVFADHRPLALSGADPTGVSVRVEVPASGSVRLGWTCRGRRSPADGRVLGLPVTRIAWSRQAEAVPC